MKSRDIRYFINILMFLVSTIVFFWNIFDSSLSEDVKTTNLIVGWTILISGWCFLAFNKWLDNKERY